MILSQQPTPSVQARPPKLQPKPRREARAEDEIPQGSTIPPPHTAKRHSTHNQDEPEAGPSCKRIKRRNGDEGARAEGSSLSGRGNDVQLERSIRHSATLTTSPDHHTSPATGSSPEARKERSLSEDSRLQALVKDQVSRKKTKTVARKSTGGRAPHLNPALNPSPTKHSPSAPNSVPAPPAPSPTNKADHKSKTPSPTKSSQPKPVERPSKRPSQAADGWDPISEPTLAQLEDQAKSDSIRKVRRK